MSHQGDALPSCEQTPTGSASYLILNTLHAVSFRATPIALPAFAFSVTHATFLCISTCCHSRPMMFERRRPVASANITTGLMLSGMHSINRSASSLVSHRILLLIGLRVLITGAVFIQPQSFAAALRRERMKERCCAFVACETCRGLYSEPAFPSSSRHHAYSPTPEGAYGCSSH